MTLIIGLDGPEGCTLLGDSYFGEPDSGLKLGTDKPKIFKRFLGPKKEKEIGFGCCGSTKIENVLHYELDLPKFNPKIETCEEYVVSSLRKHLTEILREHMCVLDDGKLIGNSEIMICFGGKIYVFDTEMSIVISKRGYQCAGIGANFATAILEYTIQRKEFCSLIDVASAVAEICSFVEAPFHILHIKK